MNMYSYYGNGNSGARVCKVSSCTLLYLVIVQTLIYCLLFVVVYEHVCLFANS